jgi:alpha-galactosidase
MMKPLCILFTLLAAGCASMADASLPILTPQPPREPRINGPGVYGARPGNPFLYRIPCTGERPIQFAAKGLPAGLALDANTGIVSGTTPAKGEYRVKLTARNQAGKGQRVLKIVAGDTLALTPPMGWNPWYVHFTRIEERHLRAAADAMIASGMADVGYQYVNLDDCWMNADSVGRYQRDPKRVGPARDANGNLLPNTYFPDLRGMTDYIHARGLKAGVYTSPGPKTCAGFTGAYQHEAQDARQFADWGFDFLKYDWCSYSGVAKGDKSLPTLQKPFRMMGDLLKQQKRDIVFNLCQYGMGNVWEWGAEVGGHSWRTAGDLGFELDRFFGVALKNAEHAKWSRPGAWNDPDYIQIGWMGFQKDTNFTLPQPTTLTADDQYSYMSLWCLMAAPLFFSGDMEKLDAFTLNVLCNPEVIAINQDALGHSARVVKLAGGNFAMIKDLEDGAKGVGLFNPGDQPAKVTATWTELGLKPCRKARDLWRQQNLRLDRNGPSFDLPRHGVRLLKLKS